MHGQGKETSANIEVAGRVHHFNIILERGKHRQVNMLWILLVISLVGSAPGHTQPSDHCKQINTHLVKVTTSQSTNYDTPYYSTLDIYTSDRAIDGKTETCAQTNVETDSWWTIDLLDVHPISSISIYNDNQYDVNGAKVFIGNSGDETDKICKVISQFRRNQWNDVTCDGELSGRYITVSLLQTKPLSLCEVKIYSPTNVSHFKLIKKTMTWEDALYYCRDSYVDLASVVYDETLFFAECEATDFMWLGLRYTCLLYVL